ncbi:uncharacterized protein L201_003681 [Kwoniella dendrophila CBS 6074]|uniref:Cytochrome b561 domain-containing protein n=1 Tax=Kwoniella dendrophila CBS 6074 TaxID=1295534 RepID=A0AAX4JW66_9TREE
MRYTFSSIAVLVLAAIQVQAAITGQQYCNKYLCITGQHDSDKKVDTYTLEPPSGTNIPVNQFGWISIGFGQTMIESPMVIVWPNSDGSITLSQRKTDNHVTPNVDNNPPRKATLLTSSSFSNSKTTSISFSLPSTSSNTNLTNLIWAYGNKNPGSSSSSTSNLSQHLASGNTQISLLANSLPSSVTSSGNNSTSSSTSTNKPTSSASGTINGEKGGKSSSTTTSTSNILIAHVVCGSIATMAILPIGIIIPRISRGFSINRWWFPTHGALNGLIAFGLIVAAFGIAKANFLGGFDSTHRKLGLTLFILSIIQVLLGILPHFWQPKHKLQTSSGRGPINFLHMLLGLVVVGVGFGTVWWGIDQEWEMYSGKGKPNVGWKVGWGLVVGITAIIYLGGFYLLPRQLKMEKERRHWASKVSNSYADPQSLVSKESNTFVPPPPPTNHGPRSQHTHSHNTHINRPHTQPIARSGNTTIEPNTNTSTNYVPPPPPKRRLPPPL